mgnify:CR=1 FL=1
MELLERLDHLRDSLIDDPKVIEVLIDLCRNGSYMKHGGFITVILNKCGGGQVEGIIYNVDYMIPFYIDGETNIVAAYKHEWKLLQTISNTNTLYKEFSKECDKKLVKCNMTIGELLYSEPVSLFDRLMKTNDLIGSDAFVDTLLRYLDNYTRIEIKNEIVDICLYVRYLLVYTIFGYIVSDKFVLFVRLGISARDVMILYNHPRLVHEYKYKVKDDDGYSRFLRKYASKKLEPTTFRQFMGVTNVKSARNF